MKTLPLIMLFACAAWQVWAQEEGDARAIPGRGLLKRGPLTKGKATTTTTTPAPQEEEEYDDEAEYVAEGEAPEPSTEAPSSPPTTEGKKLVAGGVRPFRSNQDLLETLKKRRAQAAEDKRHGHQSSTASAIQEAPTDAPAKSSYSKKRVNEDAKPNRGRFGGKPVSARSVQEDIEENDTTPQARSSRFSRRGGRI